VYRLIVIGMLALSLAACGGDDGTDEAQVPPETLDALPPAGDDAAGTVMAPIGPTLGVAELLEAEGTGPYSVRGYLFVNEDGTMVFSDTIAESYPPQPGGARVPVTGINLQTVPLIEPDDPGLTAVQWTDRPIELIGFVEDGVFLASTPASS
jgi:hypothetical protein